MRTADDATPRAFCREGRRSCGCLLRRSAAPERGPELSDPLDGRRSAGILSVATPAHSHYREGSAMQLGFVSAILPELTLEEVLAFAANEGFGCVELMCWPPGGADRRYAGVTHIDVSDFTPEQAAHVRDLLHIHGVAISGLGYYPNPLDPDRAHRRLVIGHLKKVIIAAPRIGVRQVNTFIGRDPAKSIEANWPAF